MFHKGIVSKEIITLAIHFLKASERFVQPLSDQQDLYLLFLFIFFIHSFIILFRFYCTGLIVSNYILLEFCVLFCPQIYVIFFIIIFCFIVSACKEHWYKNSCLIRYKQITWGKMPQSLKSTFWEKWDWSFNPINSTFIQNNILYVFYYKTWTLLQWNHDETMKSFWNKWWWMHKIACFSFLRN